jgi:3D (Asp-Asp-Asp) domain-containing protein
VTGTPVSGTTLTPINRTRGSSKVTTATIQDGVDITGLTSAGTLERIILVANNNNSLVFVDRPIVLQAGQAIALAADTGTAAINFRVDFWVDLSDPQVVP